MAEFREALKNAAFGTDIGGGSFLDRLLAGIDRPPVLADRPGPRDDQPTHVDRDSLIPVPAGRDDADEARQATLFPGPVPAADATDTRIFAIQAGTGEQTTPARRADLQLGIPIGADPRMLAELERAETSILSGSWTALYLNHDFRGLDGSAENKVEYDTDGFDALKASGQGFAAAYDTLTLSGDFSAGFTLSQVNAPIGRVSLQAGNDYVLIADDDFVRGDTMMIVDGARIGAGNHLMFDGSAETNGRYTVNGSAGDDIIFGGAGNDWLRGGRGADVLTGGDGADTFVYTRASESTGANYDTLADFDPLADRIDLTGNVTGFAATVQTGSLSDSSFAHDLASALSGLGANQAALFRPDSGDHAGTVFLVVDGNGVAGYQEGEDYVFALPGTTLADLAGHTDFFI